MNSSSNSTDLEVPDYNNFEFPYLCRFLLYLILDIPAIICSLIILIVFVTDRQCRNGVHNHSIIVLIVIVLISELFDIPIYIDQLHLRENWSKSPIFCYIWRYIDSSCFAVIPVLLSCIGVLIRTIRQRQRFNQPIQWRKLRRMTIQLICLSSLFLIFCFPATICFSLLPFEIFNTNTLFYVLPYAAYFSYYPQLILPFICFFSIPELLTKIKRFIQIYHQQRTIVPHQTNQRITHRTNLEF